MARLKRCEHRPFGRVELGAARIGRRIVGVVANPHAILQHAHRVELVQRPRLGAGPANRDRVMFRRGAQHDLNALAARQCRGQDGLFRADVLLGRIAHELGDGIAPVVGGKLARLAAKPRAILDPHLARSIDAHIGDLRIVEQPAQGAQHQLERGRLGAAGFGKGHDLSVAL